MVSSYNLHGQIMACFDKAVSNFKTQISNEYFNIDHFIWEMIYHKIITNLMSQKCVLKLTGVLGNNDNLSYDFTQNWQISNLNF